MMKIEDDKLFSVVQATYKITTPMFIGDAKQEATRINPQSFKGALRFWWRALMWGKIRQYEKTDEAALKKLHHQESILFGGIAVNPNGKKADEIIYGKGKFALKITQPEKLEVNNAKTVHNELKNYPATRYLGYGVVEAFASARKNTKAGQLIRDCIKENQQFTVSLIIEDKQYISEISNVLKIIGLLGGLGSKARKGFGSINITELSIVDEPEKNWHAPQNLANYKKEISNLLANINNCDMPPISAFSHKTFIEKIGQDTNIYKLLDTYGKAMMLYRSWGKDGKVLNKDSEKNFKDDHDWSKQPDNYKKDFHPRRIIFGMPQSYGILMKNKNKMPFLVGSDMGKVDKSGKGHGRRASPLFFHIQQIGNEFIGVAYILRARFLPEKSKINAHIRTVNQKIEWNILLDDFLLDKKRFPHAEVIFGGEK